MDAAIDTHTNATPGPSITRPPRPRPSRKRYDQSTGESPSTGQRNPDQSTIGAPRRPNRPPRGAVEGSAGSGSPGGEGAPRKRAPRRRPPKPSSEPGGSTQTPETTGEGGSSATKPSRPPGARRGAKFNAGLTEGSSTPTPSSRYRNKAFTTATPAPTDLTSTLIHALRTPPYPDCPICFSPIHPAQRTWSCSPSIPVVRPEGEEQQQQQYCWTTFHVKCIGEWAAKSVKDMAEAWRARGEHGKKGDWRCPGCQAKREVVPSGAFVTRPPNLNPHVSPRHTPAETHAHARVTAGADIPVPSPATPAHVRPARSRRGCSATARRKRSSRSGVVWTREGEIYRAVPCVGGPLDYSTVEYTNASKHAIHRTHPHRVHFPQPTSHTAPAAHTPSALSPLLSIPPHPLPSHPAHIVPPPSQPAPLPAPNLTPPAGTSASQHATLARAPHAPCPSCVHAAHMPLRPHDPRPAHTVRHAAPMQLPVPAPATAVWAPTHVAHVPRSAGGGKRVPAVSFFDDEGVCVWEEDGGECEVLARRGEGVVWECLWEADDILPQHHPCPLPCHAPSTCPEDTPCQSLVTLTCPCSRIRQSVHCGRSTTFPSGSERAAPKCNNECAVAKRNARLAEALGITPETREKGERVVYHEEVLAFGRANAKFVGVVEKAFEEFVVSGKKTQVLPHMPPERRKFVHDLAAVYRMDTQMVDQEPHRSVRLLRRLDTRIPTPLVSSVIAASTPAQPSLGKLADLRAAATMPSWRAPAPPKLPSFGAAGPPPWAAAARPTSAAAGASRASGASGSGRLTSSAGVTRASTPTPAMPAAQTTAEVPDSWEDDV
ncbi:FKBP12-associated protein 1 [Hypsizygus marmoreus]|uniref:FKBP12-associated protein 1 n=1 Tax=Hypsizygus marmoreus TaxID=39966 RepID=A0A369K722_HYPMA|nr:FKBP12-associated protein 1 [Hypsizygus marmoreus]